MKIHWRRSFKRPLILLGINLLAGILTTSVVYGYASNQENRHDRLVNEMRNLSYRRETAASDLAYVEANRDQYAALLARGLLGPQDRLAAASLLERLRQAHGLNSIQYSFSPERERPLGDGRLARITVRATNVTIDLTAVTDLDALAFVRSVAARLPGDVQVEKLRLERRQNADEAVLARLRAGQAVDLVDGHLELEWRTLALPEPRNTAGG